MINYSELEETRILKKRRLVKEVEDAITIMPVQAPVAAEYLIEEHDMLRIFRQWRQPIRLFGESQEMRLARVKALDSGELRPKAQTNQVMTMLEANEKSLAESLVKGKNDLVAISGEESQAETDFTNTGRISLKLLKSNQKLTCALLLIFFKRLLSEWDAHISEQSEDHRRSATGRQSTSILLQTQQFIKPLFRGLKKDTLGADVLKQLTLIVYHINRREYNEADSAYMTLSIGNAAWPLGVTSVRFLILTLACMNVQMIQ